MVNLTFESSHHRPSATEQAMGSAAIAPEVAEDPLPPGFTRRENLLVPVVLDGYQFDKSVAALDRLSYKVAVTELTTDANNVIRVCDLRTELARNLKKVSPKSRVDQERADAAFYHDLRTYTDTRQAPKVVKGVSGVFYSSVGGSKIRSYWMPVTPEEQGAGPPMVARLGECGNASQQVLLYHQLFNLKM